MSKHRARRSRKPLVVLSLATMVAAGVTFAALSGGVGPSEPARAQSAPVTVVEPEPAVVEPAPIAPPVEVIGATRVAYAAAPLRDTATGSLDDVPDAALAAYRTAESVMESVEKREPCAPSWSVLAAIGRHASDHGRTDGSELTEKGFAVPAIFGARADAQVSPGRVPDSDAGLIDGAVKFDRPVGPMQFVPATWTMVAVDADGDGQRDPQNINDAALAAAVLLCGSEADLSTEAGARKALRTYNPAPGFASAIMRLSERYLADYEAALAVPLVPPVVTQVGPDPAPSEPVEPGPSASEPTPTSQPTPESEPDLQFAPPPSAQPTPVPSPTSAPSQAPSEVTLPTAPSASVSG